MNPFTSWYYTIFYGVNIFEFMPGISAPDSKNRKQFLEQQATRAR